MEVTKISFMDRNLLFHLYFEKKLSMAKIAQKLNVSVHKVDYWMDKYGLKRRSLSEAIYLNYNPNGDPFKIKKNLTNKEQKLLGLGLGIYWGEGHKTTNGVRVSNTDPKLINKFIDFLVKICQIDRKRLRFWLQIFNDINEKEALQYWMKEIGMNAEQILKPTITQSRGRGTYKRKVKYGVLSVIFGNTRLKRKLLSMLE